MGRVVITGKLKTGTPRGVTAARIVIEGVFIAMSLIEGAKGLLQTHDYTDIKVEAWGPHGEKLR